MFNNAELVEYFKSNVILIKEHNFSLSELDHMLPYERDIYILSILEFIEKKKEMLKSLEGM